jgi:diguanylate cyclase (GGDEF)-like protein/PAS domain S-box-containing protein
MSAAKLHFLPTADGGPAPAPGPAPSALAQVIEASDDAIVVKDLDGVVTLWNAAAATLYGYAASEAVGQTLDQLHAGDLSPAQYEAVRARIRAGRPTTGVVERRRKSGEGVRVLIRTAPLHDPQGRLAGEVTIARDVTALGKAEAALQEAQARLEGIVNSAMDAIVTTDEQMRVQRFNPAAERLFGRSAAQMLGQSLALLVPERLRAAHAGHMHEFGASGVTSRSPASMGEVRALRADGTEFVVEASISRNEHAGQTYFTAILRDATERARMARAFHLLSRCQSALVRAQREHELLEDICALAVDTGGYRMAWIGLAEDGPGQPVCPVARAGRDDGYLDLVNASWGDNERGRGPCGRAIRTGRTVVIHDFATEDGTAPWRAAAAARGYRASIALPLFAQDRAIGTFCLYAAEAQAFGADEVQLLEQLAGDLTFGIQTLRSRAAHEQARQDYQRESEKNRALLRSASDGIHILDPAGRLVEASDAFCAMLGYTRAELIGQPVTLWDAQMNAEELAEAVADQLGQHGRSQFETRHRRKDGTIIEVEVSGLPLELDGGPVLFNSSRDITARKQAEASLRDSELRLRAVIEQSPISIAFARDGRIVEANAVLLRTFGYERLEELRGRHLLESIAPERRAEVLERIRGRIEGSGVEPGYESVGQRRDGSRFPVLVSAERLVFPDGPLTIVFAVDITRQKASEEEIRRLAFYDQLTELPNRRLLLDRLRQATAAGGRSRRYGALLYIDLDDFKSLNDTRGHATGDALLQHVAARLRACVREGDTIARMGGDEFVVVLEELGAAELEAAQRAEAVAGKILAALRPPCNLGGQEYHCSASIGVAMFLGQQGADIDLVKQADIAMYQAKKSGRNSLRFFDPRMQEAINAQAALEAELHQALRHGQFELRYQVQVDRDGRPFGAEALIRWMHPVRGQVSPAEFIPVAERTDLIVPIGRWVLDTACAQLARWSALPATRHLVLCVNVSARQFRQEGFVEEVGETLRRHGVAPERLILELTESLLLGDVEDTVATMNALRAAGVRFSLDDFGTGYSSLQYLKRLPLHQLKIDQSFVRDIAADGSDLAIVRTIIAMAASLGLRVIAEGVETTEQHRLLGENGCTEFQGYRFGKPLDIAAFEAALATLGPA